MGAAATLVSVPANETLFEQDERSNNVFLVLHGTVGIELWLAGRGNALVQRIGPGELVGWNPLLGSVRMTATARPLEDCHLIRINAGALMAICQRNPRFGMELMQRTAMTIARRLQAARLELADVYCPVTSE